jgi:hypothetical protein
MLLLIVTEICDEVLNGDLHDTKSHIKTAIIFGTSHIFGLIAGINFGFIVYGLIRLAIFDLIFGKLFKNDWFYLGTTSKWDKVINNVPLPIMLGLRFLALILSIIII